jgi:cytoskeleton protein RodZ
MPAFGENLRREREMRGVSLEEISSATKISLRFLEAIEREDFSKLPGGIFSRSFIRTYARYLGLDEERVVAEFQLAAQPQVEFDLHRMAAGASNSGRQATRTPLIATLVALVLLAGGYALFRYSPRASVAPAPPPPAPVMQPKPEAPPAQPVPTTSGDGTAVPGVNPTAGGETPAAAPGTPTATAPSVTPNPQGGPAASVNPGIPSSPQAGNPPATKPGADTDLVLQVAATDRAWVAVDADGKTVLQRVLNPNEVETLKAHKSFDVTTGNAQSVILTLNGETLKPLGRRGEVKSVHLSREDLKNSAP